MVTPRLESTDNYTDLYIYSADNILKCSTK